MIGRLSHGWLRRPRPGIAVLITAALTLATVALPARADDDRHDSRPSVETGKIVPLGQLLARIRQEYGGRVLKVELEREDHEGEAMWVYEVKMLTPEGSVLKLEYDAASMELLKVKGHYRPDHGQRDKDD